MSHYFDNSPNVASHPEIVEVLLPGDAFDYVSDAGVFSHGQLDVGTKILLSDAPDPPEAGTFLDLGCGAGPIALALARRSPGASVWAVDINKRALELTRSNAHRLGLGNVHVGEPDDVPSDVVFDLIWSNPPIKVGKDVLHRMLTRWLARLTPDGHAILVVNKHLGSDSLARWLGTEGYEVERLGSRRGYRLLDVWRA
ncbi:MAG: hypothetical protein RIS33_577 [Actinomycetota bacterium]